MSGTYAETGRLILAPDNLPVLERLRDGVDAQPLAGRVDLVYIDPPFFLQTDFRLRSGRGAVRGKTPEEALVYGDTWDGGLDDYLAMLRPRLAVLREVLAPTGSLFVHSDWHAGHYVKVLLDELFGYESFRNEIVWSYGGSGRGAKAVAGQFPRNHDVIFWYGSSGKTKYRPQRIERRTHRVNASKAGYRQDASGRWFKTAPRGDYTDASIAALEAEGRVHRTTSGSVRIKYFLRETAGHVAEDVLVGDVWSDIPDAMHLPREERTGYPTQKPLKLLRRILAACTDPGDLVLDCFCGSGTTAVAAETMPAEDGQPGVRRWIVTDSSPQAIATARDRLIRAGARPFSFEGVPQAEEAGTLAAV